MAYGDKEVLAKARASLIAGKGTWGLGIGYQPGVVVIAIATRLSPEVPPEESSCVDVPIPLAQIDAVIEQLQRAKVNAQRKPQ